MNWFHRLVLRKIEMRRLRKPEIGYNPSLNAKYRMMQERLKENHNPKRIGGNIMSVEIIETEENKELLAKIEEDLKADETLQVDHSEGTDGVKTTVITEVEPAGETPRPEEPKEEEKPEEKKAEGEKDAEKPAK